ncbi:TrbL/VirB6 plasmid conjugal transfer protein, partial [Dysosmobacter welbionis]
PGRPSGVEVVGWSAPPRERCADAAAAAPPPAGIWCSGRLSRRRPGVVPAMAGALPPLCGHCTIVSPKKLVLWRTAAPPGGGAALCSSLQRDDRRSRRVGGIVGHQQYRPIPRRLPDAGQGQVPVLPVQAGEGLVQRQRVKGRQQRPCQGQPPLHAAGELPHRLRARVRQAQPVQQGPGRGGVINPAQHKPEIALSGEVLQQPVLLEHGGEPLSRKPLHRAAVRPLQPQQDAQQGGLAGPGGRHDGRNAGSRSKGQVPQHRPAPEGFAQVLHRNLHQLPAFLTAASTRRRNSRSNITDTVT